MPPRGVIIRKRRIALQVYSYAVEANPPGTTHGQLQEWVRARKETWAKDFQGWQVPEISRASDYIREITQARGWLDDPWHLGIFAAHNSAHLEPPPDAVPDVMAVALRVFAGGKRLTARQAAWVARLRGLLPPIRTGDDLAVQDAYAAVVSYSARERAAASLAEATRMSDPPIPPGHESDTWALDFALTTTPSGDMLIWDAFDAATEAGILAEGEWEGGSRVAVRPESPEVAPLADLLLETRPEFLATWRGMASALLLLRARVQAGVVVGDVPLQLSRGLTPVRMAHPGAADWAGLTRDEQKQETKLIADVTLERFSDEIMAYAARI